MKRLYKLSNILNFTLSLATVIVVLFAPFLSLILFIPLCVALVVLKSRFGMALPLGIIIFGGVGAYFFQAYLLVMYGVLVGAFFSLIIGLRQKNINYVPPIVMGGVVMGFAALLTPLMLIYKTNLDDTVYRFIINSDAVFIRLCAQEYYDNDKELENKLSKGDEGYLKEAKKHLGEYARSETAWYLYYILGYNAIFVLIITYLTALFLDKIKTKITKPKLCEMRLDRTYLFVVVFPVLVFSLFSLYPPFRPLTATVFNFMVTVPCAFSAFTLLLHTVMRGNKKVRICFGILLGIVSAAALVFSIVLLIVSFFGFADCVLNVRKMLDYALKKPDKKAR